MATIALKPDVLRWARERAGLDVPALAKKVGTKPEKVQVWEQTGELTFGHAEKLAHHTHTPIGHLFLVDPPEDRLPIPDFRTVGDRPVRRPSPELLDTVQAMQRRQSWMRDDLIEEGQPPLAFVGSRPLNDIPDAVAADILKVLGLERDWARGQSTWENALVELRHRVEAAGILIVINGVVGNNTHRPLETEEFRGFALCDAHAPLVFINGSDAKGAQMFTIAHELAHLWIGQDGVSNFEALQPGSAAPEQFCNKVAAEFLVPEAVLRECWQEAARQTEPYQYLARRFKISPLVAARRALDLALISRDAFFTFYREYQDDDRRVRDSREGGGDFFKVQNVRVGERFGRAVVRAAKAGRLLYRDAFQLTGLSGATFDKYARSLGFDTP
ncbi:ImmA/IrrE family metallo-endopeptidase [Solimonas variicoloris]|uniref:ImmA/IrrE family metallo-endopeptidase n=1 Tax=Solimonas variicoloris TaxID=254408 RepID=UPI00035E2E8D|nr:ImmA/IrrE family metallo-endopeptidase [Solimonas variicoloris]